MEYSKTLNPSTDPNIILTTFRQVLIQFILEQFHIAIHGKDIVLLESCSDEKFSYHAIVDHPKLIFKNTYHAGIFVSRFCHSLQDHDDLYFLNETQERILLIDQSNQIVTHGRRLFQKSTISHL